MVEGVTHSPCPLLPRAECGEHADANSCVDVICVTICHESSCPGRNRALTPRRFFSGARDLLI
jgi:hypothetical protein